MPEDIYSEFITIKTMTAAIQSGAIRPEFQPIVDLQTESIVGLEVLARWTESDVGQIAPAIFIPFAEKHGLIELTTEHLFREACTQAMKWPGEFILAFNLSPMQFKDSSLARKIFKIVEKTGFPFNRLHIEITESALLKNDKVVQTSIAELKAAGMGIALDDFGTGFASLTELHAFPFDKLKIDMSFVRSITTDSISRKIVSSVIGLGQSLGMTIVAEGVETKEQARILKDLGCDLGQGWLFGKALPADKTLELLKHHEQAPLKRYKPATPSFHRIHQLEALYESAPVGLCLIDTNLVIISANARYAEMFFLSPEDLIGHSVGSFLPSDDANTLRNDFNRVLEGECIAYEAYRPFASDKSYFMLNQRVDDGDGKPIGISVITIDVTAYKSLESLQSHIDDHARWTIDISPNISWAADSQGVVYFMGPTPDIDKTTTNERIQDWISRIHSDDRSRVHNEWLQWLPCEEPFVTIFRLRLKGDNYHWMLSIARPHFDEVGNVDKWHGIITEIKSV